MPQSPGNQSPSDTTPADAAGFGANEWLVEEMQEQYRKDPASVDPAWRAFFEGTAAPAAADGVSHGASNGASNGSGAPAASGGPRTSAGPAKAPARSSAPAKAPEKAPEKAPQKAPQKAPEKAPAAQANPVPKATKRPEVAAAEPARGEGTPVAKDPRPPAPSEASDAPTVTVLRGAPARTAKNMDESLSVPTATSVRSVPVKLLWDNRVVINNHLARARGGKVSFTHLIGFALVKALRSMPEMNVGYDVVDGKPHLITPAHVNLGLAIDVPKPDGTRQLLVPSIKAAETMDFAAFWTAYEDVVRKARDGKLTVGDFQGTTISLTNPGTIGTNHSVPRLMKGQGAIIGVGAMEYPPGWQGASEDALTRNAISRIMTITSTYDHRVIQGAQSGEFLRRVHQLLLGAEDFYDEIFRSLRIPYEPIRWAQDIATSHDDEIGKQARILELIHAFRVRGHMMADTDPLEYRQRSHPDLEIESHGLTLWDLDREFATGSFGGEGRRFMKLRQILGILRDSYVRTTGIEYMHIQDPEQRRWLQQRVEQPHTKPPREEQLRILLKLNQAEAFETFLQTKFVGQKRFSLEGGETTVAVLDEICEAAAEAGLDEVAMGMAHRGRLNVLANIVGKKYSQIFREFEGNIDPRTVQGSGDVKYHLGAEGEFEAGTGDRIKVSVAANPSHLEAVDPVLEGIARAKQDVLDRGTDYPVLPLLVHGDAAFAGQGVVAETLNLSQLRGYRTGGTIHVIVNNQVGFTTSPGASRSSLYCTDVARMVQAPIFHVNGDDPEACIRVARLAFEYRQAFNKDVVIDLVCYRRRGHNEGDDPSYTQPLMYDLIEQKRSVRKLYTESLIGRGDITVEEAEQVLRDYQQQLERVFTEVREATAQPSEWTTVPDYPEKPAGETATAIGPEVLKRISDAYVTRRGLHGAPQGDAAAAATRHRDHRGPDRLGHRRDPGLRLAADGRSPRAPGRSGLAPRHLRAALRHHHRPPERRRVDPAVQPHRGPGEVPRLRLAAQRVRRPRVRVRLLRRASRGARAVGGAVRRLRQRRADDHRRVHLLGRDQVAPAVRRRAPPPPRLRGPGPRPLLGAHRAVHDDDRRGRLRGRAAEHPGVVLPPAAPPLARRGAPPAGGLHAEVDAQAQGGRLAARGLHLRHLPPVHRRRGRRQGGRRQPCCSARVASPGTSWWSAASARTASASRSAASSSSTPARSRTSRPSWRRTRT